MKKLLAVLLCSLSLLGRGADPYGTVYIVSGQTQPFVQNCYLNGAFTALTDEADRVVYPVGEYMRYSGTEYDYVFSNTRLPQGTKLDGWVLARVDDLRPNLADVTNPAAVYAANGPDVVIPKGNNAVVFRHWDTSDRLLILPCFSWLTYRLHYDSRGGAGDLDQSYIYTNKVTISTNELTRPGYTFLGWGTTTNATTVFAAGQTGLTGADFAATTNGLVTLYSQWRQNTYTVTFKYHDDNGEISKEVSVKGAEAAEAPTDVHNWTDHVFKGWDASFNSVTSDMTVNAVYEELQYYTVRFDHGEGGEGEMEGMRILCDVTTNLPPCTFTRSGYKFDYWKSNFAGYDHTYDDGGLLPKNTAPANTMLTLVAQWVQNRYTVSFDANGGSGTMSDQRMSYGQEKALSECTFAKTGYSFAGWNTQADGKGVAYAPGEKVVNLVLEDGGSITLYAQWSPVHYGVSFDANGGAGEMTVLDAVYDTDAALPQNAFTRTGYHFIGWAAEPAGEVCYEDGATVLNLTATPNGTVKLYAVWEANVYEIRFRPNGEFTPGADMPEAKPVYDQPFDLPRNVFVRAGYVFAGWNSAADGSGKSFADGGTVVNLASEEDAVVELWAQWTAITYTIRFAGGEGSMDDVTGCTYDEPVVLPSSTLTDPFGRTFRCWQYQDQTFEDGATVSNLATTEGEVVVLEARWQAVDGALKEALDIDDPNDRIGLMTSGGWKTEDPLEGLAPQQGTGYLTARGAVRSEVSMVVRGGGTISFAWCTDGLTMRQQLLSFFVNGVQREDVTPLYGMDPAQWVTVSDVDLTDLKGTNTISWVFTPEGSYKYSAFLDHVVWTPVADENPEPTEADAPVIESAGVSGTGFGLSFTSDGRFDYELIGSADLTAPQPWPVLKSATGTGESISFDDLIDGTKPKMFYKVRVIQRQ